MTEIAKLARLYRGMLRIRVIEERIAALYSQQEMRCPVHLCIGQEAVPVAVCDVLEVKDYAVSGHRSHGHFLAKGGSLPEMMAEIYGRSTGSARGKGGSMHLIDPEAGFLGAAPIVGSTIPIGVGAAFGSVLKGEGDRVTIVFLGDGAAETGVFYESITFAHLHKLPCVFVCENNFFSVYSPLEVRQPLDRPLTEVARGVGLAVASGDGNDVLAVRDVAAEAVARARAGLGPSFLEFTTYRWREHCGPNYDNDIGYRDPKDFEAWKERCPVAAGRAKLIVAGMAPADLDAMVTELDLEMDEAVAFAKGSAFPSVDVLMDDIFGEAT